MNLLLRLRTTLLVIVAGALGACAQVRPPLPSPEPLLHDELFGPSSENVQPGAVFELTDEMRRFADNELRPSFGHRDARRVLVEALQDRGQLRVAYDASRTGNAHETFEARQGNCLALVIMTGAFARYLDLAVTYRAVNLEPQYSRMSGLTLENGHVNLLMAQSGQRPLWGAQDLVVDFMPNSQLIETSYETLDEPTVVAMYMNNRAAETLAEGRVDDAYAWIRAALRHDPAYSPAANTLAVIYMRRGADEAAERALRYALAREPSNTAALSNLVGLLRKAGRQPEAEVMAAELKRLQPYPPFHFYEAGRRALAEGRAGEARDLFARELRRQPFQHEVHFWAAQAAWALGDRERAAEHLRQAMDYSTTLANQKLYGAKLAWLRSIGVH